MQPWCVRNRVLAVVLAYVVIALAAGVGFTLGVSQHEHGYLEDQARRCGARSRATSGPDYAKPLVGRPTGDRCGEEPAPKVIAWNTGHGVTL